MPETPLGYIPYPPEGDTSWYNSTDGLETWLARIELLGIPTYDTFSDLPDPSVPETYNPGTGQTQHQFAAVVEDTTIYRVNYDQTTWEPWVGNEADIEDKSTDSTIAGEIPRSQGDGSILMERLQHGDLSGVSADQHHAQVHDNADHSTDYLAQTGGTVTGATTYTGGLSVEWLTDREEKLSERIQWTSTSDTPTAILLFPTADAGARMFGRFAGHRQSSSAATTVLESTIAITTQGDDASLGSAYLSTDGYRLSLNYVDLITCTYNSTEYYALRYEGTTAHHYPNQMRFTGTYYGANFELNAVQLADCTNIAEVTPSGEKNVQTPMYEMEDRIATRTWVENNVSGSGGSSVVSNLSVENWNVIDVGNNGFPGDRTGGDVAQFIADNTSAGSRTLFVLPDGTYDWNRSLQFVGDSGGTYDEDRPDFIGIIGKQEATLHVDIGADVHFTDRKCFQFGNSTTGIEKVMLKNLHFDIGDHNNDRDAGIMRCYIDNWAIFEDISLTGRKRWEDGATGSDSEKNGDRHTFKLDCTTKESAAWVRDVRLPHGDIYESGAETAGHAIPIAAEDYHEGTTYWENCYVEGFIDNAYYLRDGKGSNYVKGCTAKDCGAGMFRLGINDHAENITMIADNAPINSTPLWLQHYRDGYSASDQDLYTEGEEESPPIVVDGFEIYANGEPVNDIIRVNINPGEVDIRNGFVRCHTDDFILDATSYTGNLSMENITIDDHATGQTRVAAINISQDNVHLDNITYRPDPPDGENGRSIIAIDGDNFTVKDSDLQGTYVPAFETYSNADMQVKGNKFEHDGSYTDPYLIRNNDASAQALWLINNDIRAYGNDFGSSSAASDFSFSVIRDNWR